jgi:NAD(P)-dependent dehydrogenase (short-subunit alcohol dehydrogenase family)
MANYLIVGGSSGIGKALVDQLVNEGHQVFATYNTQETISNFPNLSFHALNVLDEKIDLSFYLKSWMALHFVLAPSL